MFADNHHNDGRIAVWLPAPPGLQETLIDTSPETYFKPPYVGVRGWIGIELAKIRDKDLAFHVRDRRQLVAPKSYKRPLTIRPVRQVVDTAVCAGFY
jgi:hypothetical protein